MLKVMYRMHISIFPVGIRSLVGRYSSSLIPVFMMGLMSPCVAVAQEDSNALEMRGLDRPGVEFKRRPAFSAGVQYVFQPTADLDSAGDFQTHRAGVNLVKNLRLSDNDSVAIRLDYIWNKYSWNSAASNLGADPWSAVHFIGLGGSYRRVLNQNWTLFAIPNVRLAGEADADAGNSIMGGGIFGATYRVHGRLSIGPGFGLMTQLEDDPALFPVLFIQWQFADEWSVGTTGGSGAALGPGLQLEWIPADKPFRASLNANFEQLRFRLDSNAPQRNGIGQDQAVRLGGTFHWMPTPSVDLSAMAGVMLGGEISIEDAQGNDWRSENYAPAPYIGVQARFNF